MERLEISSRKLEIPRDYFTQRWAQRGQKWYGPNRSRRYQKRWQEYMAELHKKYLHDPDIHDGVITHLQPNILECEVKWALGSITINKANGGDGIPGGLFEILKDDAAKCCIQLSSKFGKLSSSHRTGKGQLSLQSQRKAMPKNARTTTQLRSSHTLVK